MRSRNKGCCCKRSGCLKNYCECFESKMPCSSWCKCVGCHNEQTVSVLDMGPSTLQRSCAMLTKPRASQTLRVPKCIIKFEDKSDLDAQMASLLRSCDDIEDLDDEPDNADLNLLTPNIIDASIQCLLAQANECEKCNISPHETQKQVLEEMGRCLVEIFEFPKIKTEKSTKKKNKK